MVGMVLQYLYPAAVALRDYEVRADALGAQSISRWDAAALGAQPTPQQLADAIASAPFLAWLAEHGGDAGLTQRRLAKELYDALDAEARALRAVVVLTVDELNDLRSWITSFKAEVAAASSLADLKTRVATLPSLPQRTYAQARTAVRNAVDNN
jgi:hypothetical protein